MTGELEKITETISDPDYVVKVYEDKLLALKHYRKTSIGEKHAVVIYKEEDEGDFVLTAFMTSKEESILERGIIWQK